MAVNKQNTLKLVKLLKKIKVNNILKKFIFAMSATLEYAFSA